MNYILAIIISYLLGSIPTGYIVGKKLKGIDIRQYGSGNIGFTNAFRVMGAWPAAIVLFVDVGKGAAGTMAGHYLAGPHGALLAGLAAVLGHSFPIFLNFKGGKLVATGLGVMLALAYREALIAIVIWLLLLIIFRYVSLSSIIAALSVPITMIIFKEPLSYKIFGIAIVAFLIIRHSSNISRLIKGTENKFGHKAR